MAEQIIRIKAKGEFTDLERGLRQLQRDLKAVTGEIDRGARKGGIFDESQVRALDLFNRRFRESMGTINRELERHSQITDKLEQRLSGLTRYEQEEIRKKINLRERELDVIRKQLYEIERIHKLRMEEARQFERQQNQPARPSTSLIGAFGGRLLGAGRFALGLAGVGGLVSLVTEAYQKAYEREIGSLDLAQRIRGSGAFSGRAVDIYNRVADVGRRNQMGYSGQESWQLQEIYSSMAGRLSLDQQEAIQRFARGYGLDALQVGAITGELKQMSATTTPKEFADMIAGSVEESGMVSRILEVMETHTALFHTINKTFRDGTAANIVAYQTALDKAAQASGMTGLSGMSGGNVLAGLAGIFHGGNEAWKWMGLRALQSYDPGRYGNMSLFELERAFEDGFNNADNLPAMSRYIKQIAGGDRELEYRILQRWLAAGGYDASKEQVVDIYEATQGLTIFDRDKIDNLVGRISRTDSGTRYDQRRAIDQGGQSLMDLEAQYNKILADFGKEYIMPPVNELKGLAVDGLGALHDALKGIEAAIEGDGAIGKLYDFVTAHWKELATVAAVGVVGANVLKVVTAIGHLSSLFGGDKVSTDKSGKGKGGFGAAVGRTVGGLSITAAIMGLADAAINAEEHQQAAKAAGIPYASPLDRLIVGAADSVSAPLEFITGKELFSRTQGYEFLSNLPGANSPGGSTASPPKSFGEEVGRIVTGATRNLIGGVKESAGTIWRSLMYDLGFKDAGDSLIDMSETGETEFQKMSRVHSEKMDAIYQEHKGFGSRIAGMLQNLFLSGVPGVSTASVSRAGSFFDNWQARVTSRFGSQEGFRSSPHRGLDIDGNQGDIVDALLGGTVAKITFDDGSDRDEDRRANTRPGGTEVVVRMPDGSHYWYSHLSNVNPALKVGSTINPGDWVGNVGGDRGKPGSGSSTTGSHLHIGYQDKYGNLRNPEELLAMAASAVGGTSGGARRVTVEHRYSIDLNLRGDGVRELNAVPENVLREEIRRVLTQVMREQQLVNPTIAGW